jgi:hypothetical protein
LLAFAASYDSPLESNDYYFESSESESEKDKLQRVYNKLYIKFMKSREINQENVQKLSIYETGRSKQIERIKNLEDELIESQLQLERFSYDKLIQMLKGRKHSSDKSGLGFDKYVASNIASSSKTVIVKPKIAEPLDACVDKGKEVVVDESANIKPIVPVLKHSKKRSLPTCFQCGITGHIRPHYP